MSPPLLLTGFDSIAIIKVVYISCKLIFNCCTAVQIGHFFAINQLKRGYFLVVCFILVYAGIYIWNFVV